MGALLATNRQLWKLNQLGLLKLEPDTQNPSITATQADALLKQALSPDIGGRST
jgi:hypothetical protein